MLTALAAAAAVLAAAGPPRDATVLLATSQALRIAEHVAEGEGYDLRDRRRYVFDLINGKGGRPFMRGYVTFGFYWDGDTVNTISINERTGLAVDPVACLMFAYPAVRADQTPFKPNGVPRNLIADLKAQSGCSAFRTLR